LSLLPNGWWPEADISGLWSSSLNNDDGWGQWSDLTSPAILRLEIFLRDKERFFFPRKGKWISMFICFLATHVKVQYTWHIVVSHGHWNLATSASSTIRSRQAPRAGRDWWPTPGIKTHWWDLFLVHACRWGTWTCRRAWTSVSIGNQSSMLISYSSSYACGRRLS
jgi:hypothetical protein